MESGVLILQSLASSTIELCSCRNLVNLQKWHFHPKERFSMRASYRANNWVHSLKSLDEYGTLCESSRISCDPQKCTNCREVHKLELETE